MKKRKSWGYSEKCWLYVLIESCGYCMLWLIMDTTWGNTRGLLSMGTITRKPAKAASVTSESDLRPSCRKAELLITYEISS